MMPLLHFTSQHADWLHFTLSEKKKRFGSKGGSSRYRIRLATPDEIDAACLVPEDIPPDAKLYAVSWRVDNYQLGYELKDTYIFAAGGREKITVDMLHADLIAEEIFQACRRHESIFLSDRKLFDSSPRPN